jgi:hypothetical protein
MIKSSIKGVTNETITFTYIDARGSLKMPFQNKNVPLITGVVFIGLAVGLFIDSINSYHWIKPIASGFLFLFGWNSIKAGRLMSDTDLDEVFADRKSKQSKKAIAEMQKKL